MVNISAYECTLLKVLWKSIACSRWSLTGRYRHAGCCERSWKGIWNATKYMYDILHWTLMVCKYGTLGTFKVDAFEKCGLRISISHFGHNSADFKYPLRAETESTHFHCPSSVLSVVRVSKKCCIIKRIKKCWRSHSVIYFSQISPSITNSAHPWPHIIKQSSDSQDRKYSI